MTSINDILYDEMHYVPIIDETIMCFKLENRHLFFRAIIYFTKDYFIIISNSIKRKINIKLPNIALFVLKCFLKKESGFDLDFYDKYKNLFIGTENIIIKNNNKLLIEYKTDTEYKKFKELYDHQLNITSSLLKEIDILENKLEKSIITNNKLLSVQKTEKINNECSICYEKTETHYICRPCNHVLKIHANCLLRATRCPICNQATTTREQVYLV